MILSFLPEAERDQGEGSKALSCGSAGGRRAQRRRGVLVEMFRRTVHLYMHAEYEEAAHARAFGNGVYLVRNLPSLSPREGILAHRIRLVYALTPFFFGFIELFGAISRAHAPASLSILFPYCRLFVALTTSYAFAHHPCPQGLSDPPDFVYDDTACLPPMFPRAQDGGTKAAPGSSFR
ncbi:hypothetical protein C8R44DRAFT_988430 [Mycena epipterygia]|nr:hypothetical protein C8R44DRAFT_988430 [Mycena epipterygia]